MSYLFFAFLPTSEVPSPSQARSYLLEGALFDDRPTIKIMSAPDGTFERMELHYDTKRKPMVLRRLADDEAESSRHEASDLASVCRQPRIVAAIEEATLVLGWEVERSELDEDPWFALHLWQAWVLGHADGLLYAPGDGIFDAQLKRVCAEGGPSARSADDE